MKVKDVMVTEFHTLNPDMTVAEAVTMFKSATQGEGRKIFGMMVTDNTGKLIGMLSMFDILLLIRPKHIGIWGMMEDLDIVGFMDSVCEQTKSVRVGDIMTSDLITVTPDTHLMMVLDIMIKKHVRRIPVVENGQIKGIIYISDLFYYFVEHLEK